MSTVFFHQERWVSGPRGTEIRSGMWKRHATKQDSEDYKEIVEQNQDAWSLDHGQSMIAYINTKLETKLSQLVTNV